MLATAAAADSAAGALPSMALPLLVSPCGRSDEEIQTKKLIQPIVTGLFFNQGFPNPVCSVALGMLVKPDGESDKGQGQGDYAGGSRKTCRLQVLSTAEAHSWVRPGSKCHSDQWVRSHSLKRHIAQVKITNLEVLPSELTLENRSYNLLAPTGPI